MLQLIIEYKLLLEKALNNKIQVDEKFLIYIDQMVKNFQHERLVHLLVTLFFGFVTILTFIVAIICTSLQTILWYLLFLIFLIVTFFYVVYYFRLENAIQELYKLTKNFFDKCDFFNIDSKFQR